MALLINLRHLEDHSLRLRGELAVAELNIDPRDEVIELGRPLEYDFEAETMEQGLLLRGWLRLPIQCVCVRCLRKFEYSLQVNPWTCHLSFEGEDPVPVNNDCVDLTPWVREDILLEFPQHPLCNQESCGLPGPFPGLGQNTSRTGLPEKGSPAWDELNKLKL